MQKERLTIRLFKTALALGCLSTFCYTTNCRSYAQSAGDGASAPIPAPSPSTTATTNNSVSLDLGSATRDITAPTSLFGSLDSANIQAAGEQRIVHPGDMLTAGEYAALSQVLGGNQQTLNLDASGRAIGGQLLFNSFQNLTNVVIPQNVTTLGGNTSGALSVLGSLSNFGTILAQPASGSSFTINAASLFNGAGANITTTLPTGLNTTPINLNFNIVNDLVNHGSIFASGALNIAAGGSIINGATNNVQQSAVQATMTATLDATLSSAIGQIINSGLISSANGNLNLQAATATSFLVNNLQGQLTALNGQINISQFSSVIDQVTKPDLSIVGGLLNAQSNTFTAPGVVRASVDQIIGAVNITGGESYIFVNGGNLELGSINLTGDPTFANTNGDVTLSANQPGGVLQFSGQDVAILASRSVFAGTVTTIDLSSNTTRGGSLFISAGLQPTLLDLPTEKYSLGGPSATGGNVELAAVSISTVDSASGLGGGNVTITANDNNDLAEPLGMGQVQIGSIQTYSVSGVGGNILLVGQSLLEVNGPIVAAGFTSGGQIELFSGAPVSTGLVFQQGSQIAGKMQVAGNAVHDVVNLAVGATTFYYNSFLTASQISSKTTINVSGDIVIQTGSTIVSDNTNLISRFGSIDGSGVTQLFGTNNLNVDVSDTGKSVIFGGNSRLISPGGIQVQSLAGPVSFGTGTLLFAQNSTIDIFAGTTLTAGDNVGFTSKDGIFLAAGSDLSLGNGGQIFTTGSAILASGQDITVGTGKTISAGFIRPATPTVGLLVPDDFLSFGGVYMIAERNLTIGSSITANGLDIAGLARQGNLSLGTGNTFIANGGNIEFFGKGQLTGANNTFNSRAVGQNNNFAGGVIELSSGFSFSPFALQFHSGPSTEAVSLRSQILAVATNINSFITTPDQPFTAPARDNFGLVLDPTIIGNPVTILNNGINIGLVLPTKLGGGIVDVSNSQLDLKKGAIFFEAVGAGSKVQMPGSTFTVESYGVLPTDFSPDSFLALVEDALVPRTIRDPIVSIRLPDFGDNTDFINQNSNRTQQFSITLGESLANRDSARQRAESAAMIATALVGRFGDSNGGRSQIANTGRTELGRVGVMTFTVSNSRQGGPALGITNGASMAPPVRVGQQRSDLLLFTTAGQVMTGLAHKNETPASIIGSRGTVVTADTDPEDHKVILHTGKVFANSGDEPLEITTVFGSVIVSKGASAAIVSEPGQPSRVVALGGKDPGTILIRPRSGDGREITIKPGEELTITLDNPNATASPSVADANPEHPHRAVITTGKVNVGQLVEGESFYSASTLRLGVSSRSAYQRLIQNISNTTGSIAPAPEGTSTFQLANGESPSRLLAEDGTVFQDQGDSKITLQQGSMFIQAKSKHTILTPFGEVDIEPGALSAVETNDRQTRVRSFGTGGMKILTAGRDLKLASGQELLLQRDRATKADSLPNDGLARRRLEHFHVAQNVEGVIGDFSVFSALSSNKCLKPIRSPQSTGDKKLNATLLKSAVALDMATGKRGRYFLQPNETASVPETIFRDAEEKTPTAEPNVKLARVAHVR